MLDNKVQGEPKLKDSQNKKRKLVILIPIFNDWEALEELLLLIDEIGTPQEYNLEILIVDDYSTKPLPESLAYRKYRQLQTVNILRLRRNLGHQRAIAVGLCYIHDNLSCSVVVVMDGDGEDNPFEIVRLLEALNRSVGDSIIFAKRSKRSENCTFRLFYFAYKIIYWLLTGRDSSVGNFSLLPGSLLRNIVVISELWNHYSASIYRSKIPYIEVNVPRSKRLAGQPKMSLVSLVTHGLSSIAVYGDVVGTRILLSTSFLSVFLLFLLLIVLLIKLFTNWGIPGWTTYVSGLLILALFQVILIGTVFSMIILSARNSSNFLPIRDYKYYVDGFYTVIAWKSLHTLEKN
ncbi:MAG: glycosyltransferase [Leptolyngbya sp. BL-A-14]